MAVELFCKKYGTGKPLIILHGLLGSLDNWHTLSSRFGQHFTVYAIDQRNHGRSPHSDEMSYEAMAEDLLAFIHGQDLSSVALIGHSMGGKTAMEFALRHPALTRALIVVDIAPRDYAPHHDHIFEALSALDLRQFRSRAAIDEALSARISSGAVRQFLMKNLTRNQDDTFRWKMNLKALLNHYDELNRRIVSSAPYDGPVLFLRGRQSDYIADSDEAGIRALFPKAEIRSLDSGHWIHAERPHELFAIVMDFLKRSLYY